MAKPKEELLTGLVQVDCDFRPPVESDALVRLSQLGIMGVDVIDSYRIQSQNDKLQVFSLVQVATNRIDEIEKGYVDKKATAFKAHRTLCAHETEDKSPWTTIRAAGIREMSRWDLEQDRIRRQAEEAQAREVEAARRKAEAEAAELKREADEEATKLRQQGEMKAAREVVAEAVTQAEAVVEQADALAEVGVIESTGPRIGGLQEARPWVGVVDDTRLVLKAIVDGELSISGDDYTKIQLVLKPIITAIAKRMQKSDLGIPGAHGERDISYRISKNAPSPVPARSASAKEDW